jgi:hypothetical protein
MIVAQRKLHEPVTEPANSVVEHDRSGSSTHGKPASS